MSRLANFIIDEVPQSDLLGEPIPKDVALKLIQRYRDTGGWGGCSTRGIWFPKDDFIKMLGMMASIEGADGMRIYLARYPEEKLPGQTDDEYKRNKNRITIVFVPTKNGKNDIFDVNIPPASSFSFEIPTTLGTTPEESFNHGQLHP